MMNIAISINRKYVVVAYVMLTSLFENNKDEDVRVFVLNSELTDDDVESLSSLAGEYGNELESVHIDKEMFPDELPTSELWSIETYYRLMMTRLLSDEMDRILYLDVDMIVNGSLHDLYNIDFEGAHFVACEDADPTGVNFPYRCINFGERIKAGYIYFNAGVMLWNLMELRGKYDLEDYFRTAKELEYKIDNVDQDLLNYVHYGHIKYVDNRYNYYARLRANEGATYEDAKRDAVIVHFLSQKPWDANGYHFEAEKLWWDYARMTPYYYELLEMFLEKTLTDRTIFLDNSKLFQSNLELKKGLDESMALNQKLFAIVNGGKT